MLLDLGFQILAQRALVVLGPVLRQLGRAWGWAMVARGGMRRGLCRGLTSACAMVVPLRAERRTVAA